MTFKQIQETKIYSVFHNKKQFTLTDVINEGERRIDVETDFEFTEAELNEVLEEYKRR